MCGIFGVIGGSLAEYVQLGERNTERGNLGFGGLFAVPSISVFRHAEPFDPARLPDTPAAVRLGHMRAPTGRRSDSLAEIHPFETPDLLLAHNGLLLNHRDYAHLNPTPAITVDSLVIIGGIQSHLNAGDTVIEAIRKTVSVLDGQQACWLYDKRTGSIYLWRVMSPIYTSSNAQDRLCFSSVKSPLTETLLDEGVIYQLTDERQLERVGTFSFYNPYKRSSP